MAKKYYNESVYLNGGEAINFFSTSDKDYLYEWADIIKDHMGNDAYNEFVVGVIEDIYEPAVEGKDEALQELGNQYKELRKATGELSDYIFKSDLDEDTQEDLNSIEADISEKLTDIGDTLCYEFDIIKPNEV